MSTQPSPATSQDQCYQEWCRYGNQYKGSYLMSPLCEYHQRKQSLQTWKCPTRFGAQMKTTETLGQNRKDTSVTITKVGGEEETIKTKEYKVQLASIDNDKGFTVKAIRIPTITTRSPQSRLHTYRTLLVHRIRNFAVTKDRSTFLWVLITHISMPVKRDKLIIC